MVYVLCSLLKVQVSFAEAPKEKEAEDDCVSTGWEKEPENRETVHFLTLETDVDCICLSDELRFGVQVILLT